MYSSFKFGFLFFIFFIVVGKIGAVEAMKVDDKTKKINLSMNSELFIDAQNHFSYEGVRDNSFSDNFKPASLQSISNGYTNSTIWMRFSIKNEGNADFGGKIEMPIPWMDKIDVYMQSGEGLSVANFGSTLAFDERKINVRSFFLPISIKPLETTTIYIKTKGADAIVLAPWLYSEKEAAERLTDIAMFDGALIGIIFIMILYNLSNYLMLRDKNYLFYLSYLVGLLFLLGTYYGYNYQLFWKESPTFNATASPLTVAFSFIVDSKPVIMYFSVVLGALVFLFLLYISALSMKKKLSGSNYLLLAWFSLALGELVSFIMTLGYVSYSDNMYDFFALMAVLNILMISFALVARVKDVEMQCEFEVKKEHEIADRLNMSKKELRELNEKLQRKVDRQEHEFLLKNIEYEKLSIKDDVTGLYNQAKLEEILSNELHRTKRYDYIFSLIIINIDGLKNINDTHGFEVGNSVMKEMADLFMRHIRYLDTVGRWSDTEYLVICPETNADNALIAAQHLQKLVEKNKFFFVGTASASFGVTSARPGDTLQDIMKRAYEALSVAKESGRGKAEAL